MLLRGWWEFTRESLGAVDRLTEAKQWHNSIDYDIRKLSHFAWYQLSSIVADLVFFDTAHPQLAQTRQILRKRTLDSEESALPVAVPTGDYTLRIVKCRRDFGHCWRGIFRIWPAHQNRLDLSFSKRIWFLKSVHWCKCCTKNRALPLPQTILSITGFI